MNLVPCGKNCAYQQDGYCTRSGAPSLPGGKVDGCCYFEPPEGNGGLILQKFTDFPQFVQAFPCGSGV